MKVRFLNKPRPPISRAARSEDEGFDPGSADGAPFSTTDLYSLPQVWYTFHYYASNAPLALTTLPSPPTPFPMWLQVREVVAIVMIPLVCYVDYGR